MKMEERIARISAFAERETQRKNSEEIAKQNHLRALSLEILELADRIRELINVATACAEHHVPLGHYRSGPDCAEFVTNGITHNLGFHHPKNPHFCRTFKPDGIGIMGGGCCGGDLIISRHGYIVTGHNEQGKMEAFLKGFDRFERDFYAFVDNYTNK